jgi:hypothetical protein
MAAGVGEWAISNGLVKRGAPAKEKAFAMLKESAADGDGGECIFGCRGGVKGKLGVSRCFSGGAGVGQATGCSLTGGREERRRVLGVMVVWRGVDEARFLKGCVRGGGSSRTGFSSGILRRGLIAVSLPWQLYE